MPSHKSVESLQDNLEKIVQSLKIDKYAFK